jgi:hypothetical protein
MDGVNWEHQGLIDVSRSPAQTISGAKRTRKHPHDLVYLPPWTFEEIEYANQCLQLEIDEKTLAERYHKFGGTARFTLTTDKDLYDFGVKSLENAYSSYFKTYEQLLDAFETAEGHLPKSADMVNLCHHLFHYVPIENYFKCRIILGSAEIIERFDTLILDLNVKERYQLVRSLDRRFAKRINILEHLFKWSSMKDLFEVLRSTCAHC